MNGVNLTLAALASCLPLGVFLAYLAGRTRGWTRPDRRVGHVCTACYVTSYLPANSTQRTIEASMVHRPHCRLNPVPGGVSIAREDAEFTLAPNVDRIRSSNRDWNGHHPDD